MDMNFDKMCRTCMCEGRKMFPIFSEDVDSPSFSNMIMNITAVSVTKNDGLPCQLCMQCVSSLDMAVNFKKLCEKSDSLFRQYVSERDSTQYSAAIVKQEQSVDHFYDSSNEICGDDFENTDDFSEYKPEPEPKTENVDEKLDIKIESKPKAAKIYHCSVCSKSYTGPKSLKRHMAVHQGEGFSCNRCDKVFSRRDHLKKHLLRVHSVEDIDSVMNSISAKPIVKYDCQYCGVDAPNKVSMAKHMRACHKDKLPKRKNSASNNYEAFMMSDSENSEIEEVKNEEEVDDRRTVGSVTTSCGGAVATIKEEKGIKEGDEARLVLEVRYFCSICGTQYDNQHSYAAHMTKHSSPLPKGVTQFSCTSCDKVFTKRKNLKQHALTHNKEKANKCTLCHRAFTRPDQLILHMNNHTGKKRHQCMHCDKGFNMLSTLKDHLRTHSGEKPYLCSICGKGFTQNTNLKQHLMRHSATKPFGCPTCLARFVSKGELDAHLRKHTGDHPFVCDTCGAGFTTSSSLVKHRRIHSGERPYACDLCPLRFTALGTLKNHRRTHTGEKPFACPHCARAFTQKSDLVSHIRTHTGERPYVCSVCGSSYQQSSALKAHIKAHHPMPDNNKIPVNIVMESQLSAHSSDREMLSYSVPSDHSQSPHFVNTDVHSDIHTDTGENKFSMELCIRANTGDKPFIVDVLPNNSEK